MPNNILYLEKIKQNNYDQFLNNDKFLPRLIGPPSVKDDGWCLELSLSLQWENNSTKK